MGLRDIAAADLAAIDADADGIAEALTYEDSAGDGVRSFNGVFIDFGTLGSRPVGIGAQRDRGEGRCRIPVAVVPHLDPKAVITRVATGGEYTIGDWKLVAGIAWRVSLNLKSQVRPRGIK